MKGYSMKLLALTAITLFTCTPQLFCADSSTPSSSTTCSTFLEDTQGTWDLDIHEELTWVKGTPRSEETVSYHLGTDHTWVIREYEEIYLHGTCGPASHSNFGIAIVNQPLGTSSPDLHTQIKRMDTISRSNFKELTKRSFFEIEDDLQLNFSSPSTYAAIPNHPWVIYPYLFLCSNTSEEFKVQRLLLKHAKTVKSVAVALQLIYPHVDPASTYIIFDVAGFCNFDKKVKDESQELRKKFDELWTNLQPKPKTT
jgi:hypothetical protein